MTDHATPTPADARAIVADLRTFAMNMRRDDSDARSDDLRFYYEGIEGFADLLDAALTAEIAEGATGAGNARVGERVRKAWEAVSVEFAAFFNDGDGAYAEVREMDAAIEALAPATPVGAIAEGRE